MSNKLILSAFDVPLFVIVLVKISVSPTIAYDGDAALTIVTFGSETGMVTELEAVLPVTCLPPGRVYV